MNDMQIIVTMAKAQGNALSVLNSLLPYFQKETTNNGEALHEKTKAWNAFVASRLNEAIKALQ